MKLIRTKLLLKHDHNSAVGMATASFNHNFLKNFLKYLKTF